MNIRWRSDGGDKKIDIDVLICFLKSLSIGNAVENIFLKLIFEARIYHWCTYIAWSKTLYQAIPIIIDTEFHRVSPSSYTFTYIPPLYSCYLYLLKYCIYLENHVHSKTYIIDQKFQIVLQFLRNYPITFLYRTLNQKFQINLSTFVSFFNPNFHFRSILESTIP